MRLVLDLQACQTSGSRNRGIGRYSMSLSLAMARRARGHEIVLMLNDRFPETIDPIREAFDGLLQRENFRIFNAIGPLAELNPANLWRTKAAERIREAFIAELSPDLVHVSSLFEGLGDDAITSVGNLESGFDTAVTLYDLIPLLNKETYLSNPLVRDWYYRKLLSLKKAELLVSISEYSRREAIAALHLPDTQVVNISSAVDPVFCPRVLSIEEHISLRNRYELIKPFVMYTGGIDYRKNIEGLIEAFAKLPFEIRDQYQLAIVCSIRDSDRLRLEALASKCGLGKIDVVFTGYIPEEDLLTLYNACTLFVFPSLHEGFGLPVLEAMRCGAPVIGSNSSSIPEVLGREDALFDPKDIAAITEKIHAALTNENFRAQLQQHGLQQAKQFSWEASAEHAWDAFEHQHDRRKSNSRVAIAVTKSRPRLAYLSPFPPEKSGIADYSAELLPELATYYDIDLVAPQSTTGDPWMAANFPLRSLQWFEEHASNFDRILYHFGNSGFHQHMFDLLSRHPGVVVLHDFFMSGALHYADQTGYMPGAFERALYHSHGYAALMDYRKSGREAAFWHYPCNRWILDRAAGIIVHSKFSMQLAERWYGKDSANQWELIPQLRALPEIVDRKAARKELQFTENNFVVCSFGLLGPTKLNDQLIEAWISSGLANDKHCYLVFVGENNGGPYGVELQQTITSSKCANRIKITGFASQELYRAYLAAADTAVQLRSRSRGETSRTILDCMAYGIPTIVNKHGSTTDFPDHVLATLPDEFSVAELSAVLVKLRINFDDRKNLARKAIERIRTAHHPAHIGTLYRDAIERFSVQSSNARNQSLIRSITAITAPATPSDQDLLEVAASIAANCAPRAQRQILVDISPLKSSDASASERALIADFLTALLSEPIEGCRVEPVFTSDGKIKYARELTLGLIGMAKIQLEESCIDARQGDLFLEIGSPCQSPRTQAVLKNLQDRGIRKIPVSMQLLRPQSFLNGAYSELAEWLISFAAPEELASISCASHATEPQRKTRPEAQRRATRQKIGISETDFVLCLLCAAGSHEIIRRFLDEWAKSPFGKQNIQVVLVSEVDEALTQAIADCAYSDIQMIDSRDKEMGSACLNAADVVFHLQQNASHVVDVEMDCLAHNVPTVVSLNRAALRAVGEAIIRLPVESTQASSTESTSIDKSENSSRVLAIFRDHIEQLANRRLDKKRQTNTPRHPGELPKTDPLARQLFVDVSFLAKYNLNSGIQRVVYHVLIELLNAPPSGYRIEPVYDAGGHFAHARRFMSNIVGAPIEEQLEEPIAIKTGDIFLGLDLSAGSIRDNRQVLEDLRVHGVQVYFVVYDLLPVQRPDIFPKDAQVAFSEWLDTVLAISDGLIGISRSVAHEIEEWANKTRMPRTQPLHLGYFHLGAELSSIAEVANGNVPHMRPTILMVGTVEPRKGHAQALAAFEKLWADGIEVDLVIVGRQGWMMEPLMTRLRPHAEQGRHLFWFEGASDETLLRLYQNASALLLASEGEGFGLPLVEAARHKLPIIARDLPVFREVAGDHAFYFSGLAGDDLYQALRDWLKLYAEQRAPSSAGIRWLSWRESTQQLLKAVIEGNWHRTLVFEEAESAMDVDLAIKKAT